MTFKVDEGPKIRIEKINIQGNKVFSEAEAQEGDEAGQGSRPAHRRSTAKIRTSI